MPVCVTVWKGNMSELVKRSDRFALRQWKHDSIKQKAKGLLGEMLLPLFPARAKALGEHGFTHHGATFSVLDRLIVAGMAYRALRRKEFGRLGEYHRKFWGGEQAKVHHDHAQDRFTTVFLKYYTPLIDELEGFMATRERPAAMCEIGSGAGLLLDYLATRFSEVERFIGLDLDPVTTEETRRAFPDPRLEFVTADAVDYIEKHGVSNWIYLTHNGVLEYFAPDILERLLRQIAALRPAAIALIEPVGKDHDFETQTDSWPYGQEFGFSHNYPHLLEKHGFRVLYRHEVDVYGVRVSLVLAEID